MSINNNTNNLRSGGSQYPEETFFNPTSRDIYLYDYTDLGEAQSHEEFRTFYLSEEYNEQGEVCFLDQLAFRVAPSFTVPANAVLKLKVTDPSDSIVKFIAPASWEPGTVWTDLSASGLTDEKRTFMRNCSYGVTVLIVDAVSGNLLSPAFAPVMDNKNTQKTYVHAIGMLGTPYPEDTPYPEITPYPEVTCYPAEGFFTPTPEDIYLHDYDGTCAITMYDGGATLYVQEDFPPNSPFRIDRIEVVPATGFSTPYPDSSYDPGNGTSEAFAIATLSSGDRPSLRIPAVLQNGLCVIDLAAAGYCEEDRTFLGFNGLNLDLTVDGQPMPLLFEMPPDERRLLFVHITGKDLSRSQEDSSSSSGSPHDTEDPDDEGPFLQPPHLTSSEEPKTKSVSLVVQYLRAIDAPNGIPDDETECFNYIEAGSTLNQGNEFSHDYRCGLEVTGPKNTNLGAPTTSRRKQNGDPADRFDPPTIELTDNIKKKFTLKTREHRLGVKTKLAENIAWKKPDPARDEVVTDHKMLPAVFKDRFRITVYYCPLESGFSGTSFQDKLKVDIIPKVKIGATVQEVTVRRQDNTTDLKSLLLNSYFYSAIEMEGWGRLEPPVTYNGRTYSYINPQGILSTYPQGNRPHIELIEKRSFAAHSSNGQLRFSNSIRNEDRTRYYPSVVKIHNETIASLFEGSTFIYSDVGGGVQVNQIDLYWGEANPMSKARIDIPAGIGNVSSFDNVQVELITFARDEDRTLGEECRNPDQ